MLVKVGISIFCSADYTEKSPKLNFREKCLHVTIYGVGLTIYGKGTRKSEFMAQGIASMEKCSLVDIYGQRTSLYGSYNETMVSRGVMSSLLGVFPFGCEETKVLYFCILSIIFDFCSLSRD